MLPFVPRLGLPLLLALNLLTAPAPAQAQPPIAEWKLSTALGPAYAQGKAGEVWARLIGERSGGRLAAKHFPGAALVQRDPARELAALRDGAIDLAVGSVYWAPQAQGLYVFALPWLFPDEAAIERTLAGEAGAQIRRQLEVDGVVVLATAASGFYQLATARPVHAPADLAGLRLRAPASPLSADTLIALGALPASMSSSEARAAFANGALDGELLSAAAFEASRLYAGGAPRLLLWDICADVLLLAINARLWRSLSEPDRDIVRGAARDAARAAAALSQRRTGEAALAGLVREGAVVTRLTKAGKEPFREKTRTVYDKWTAIVGEAIVRAAESAARE